MRKQILILLLAFASANLSAQSRATRLTLAEAIEIAHSTSPKAKMAELSFMSQYWSFRSHKAELLPSINLEGGLGSYNRSVVEARDSETGEINYVSNNTLTNDLTLSLDQEIALTGGTISIETSLSRLDQFNYNNVIYNSVPISINYSQPLRGYNTLKWQKKTAPLEYESAKRALLESMESITIQTTTYFFNVLSAQTTLQNAERNYEDTKRMYEIAQKRFEIGTITKSELLQLELSMLNSELDIRDYSVAVDIAKFNLKFYIGIASVADVNLVAPSYVPTIILDYDFVLDRALANSSHDVDQQLTALEAEMSVAQAKANRGIQLDLSANLGLSQTAYTLPDSYVSLRDKEIVGLSFSMPIFDWGMSRGKIKMAQAELDLVLTEIEQEEIEFRQDIRIKIIEFNNQTKQCDVAQKVMEIANERYAIMVERFQNGGVTVTDLNTAQQEMDSANNKYITQLQSFWSAYYDIQKLSLYDFILNRDISASFDNIIDNQL